MANIKILIDAKNRRTIFLQLLGNFISSCKDLSKILFVPNCFKVSCCSKVLKQFNFGSKKILTKINKGSCQNPLLRVRSSDAVNKN